MIFCRIKRENVSFLKVNEHTHRVQFDLVRRHELKWSLNSLSLLLLLNQGLFMLEQLLKPLFLVLTKSSEVSLQTDVSFLVRFFADSLLLW